MIVAVVGPTATGKSALGLWIAEAAGGEVINADAMQLYRGMDVGTAKLTPAERGGVAHHQLDVLQPWQEASVAAYQRAARSDAAAIAARGHLPVVVGGSGLYVRAVLDRIEFPGTDAQVRAAVERRLAAGGPHALHDELRWRDPEAAARIAPANARRVVRALEVIELTGRPFSASLPQREYVHDTLQVGLRLPEDALRERISVRVDQMLEGGFVEEVARLGAHLSRTAASAVGYPQLRAHLAGQCTLRQAREDTVMATWRLVKKQLKWFGADPRIAWFPTPEEALAHVLARLEP